MIEWHRLFKQTKTKHGEQRKYFKANASLAMLAFHKPVLSQAKAESILINAKS